MLKSINNKLQEIIDIFQIKQVVSKTLADFSKEPKATNTYTKFTVEYNGETYVYSKNAMCKYCAQHYTAWKKPYVAGDRPIAVDLDGKVIEGGCPKFN